MSCSSTQAARQRLKYSGARKDSEAPLSSTQAARQRLKDSEAREDRLRAENKISKLETDNKTLKSEIAALQGFPHGFSSRKDFREWVTQAERKRREKLGMYKKVSA